MTARVARSAVLAAVALLMSPAVAHADAARPTDWLSEIVMIEPPSDAISMSIEGGDAFVRIKVAAHHEVIVEGYDGEPYLRIDGTGAVYENRNSYATYYNVRRDGSAQIPSDLDTTAPPDWHQIGDGGTWAWHDHRAHMMGDVAPPGVSAGDSLTPQVLRLTVDGVDTEITIRTTLVARPSWWIALAGAALGLAIGIALLRVTEPRWRAATLAVVALGALVVGIAQFTSLPAETGPRIAWWLMPCVAASGALALVVVGRRAPLARHALALVAASQLVLWGWMRRHGVRRGVVPTELPFDVDRVVTVTSMVVGAMLVLAVVIDLRTMLTQPRSTASTA